MRPFALVQSARMRQRGSAALTRITLPWAPLLFGGIGAYSTSVAPALSKGCVRLVSPRGTPRPLTAWDTRRRFQHSDSAIPDHYATLRVSPKATPDEIKAAYKKMAFEFHPDRNHTEGAEERFKNISAAYNVLGHEDRRQEYDAQRAMYGVGARSSGGGTGPSSRNFSSGFAGPGVRYERMSKQEADQLFRDIFGGMQIDQIFRSLEREMRQGETRAGGGLGSGVGFSFPHGEQGFRPYFRTESSTNIFVDSHGNRLEEKTYTSPDGKRFSVRHVSSTDPNASTNQTSEDFYRSHTRGEDGRVHFGRASFKGSGSSAPGDFAQSVFGVRSHGRSPLVGFLLLGAWTVVLGTIFYALFSFFFWHPFFSLAIVFLIMVGRGRF